MAKIKLTLLSLPVTIKKTVVVIIGNYFQLSNGEYLELSTGEYLEVG